MIGGRSGRCAPGTPTMGPTVLPPGRRHLQQQQQQQQQREQEQQARQNALVHPVYQNLVGSWNGSSGPPPHRSAHQPQRHSPVGVAPSPATDATWPPSSASATVDKHQQQRQQQQQQQQQRKRPGCLCDCSPTNPVSAAGAAAAARSSSCAVGVRSDEADDTSSQPLDLSLPKIKVRQHWSGGSIVQVNDSTVISIRSDGDWSPPPSAATTATAAAAAGRFDVSVVTRPPPDGWMRALSATRAAPQVRLHIEIPLESGVKSAVSSSPSTTATATTTSGAAMSDDDDDLKRLADSAQQLRQCGFYYAHLSWKDSVQLLQNAQVGTFLVRDSSDARYLYALSIQTDKGPTSVRIHYSSRGFRLDATQSQLADHLPRFRTVLHLVDHYVVKGSQCRDKGQFWLDNSGQVHSEVQLTRPLRREVSPLQHLCRLAWNEQRQPVASKRLLPALDEVPKSIRSYLSEYPFMH